MQGQASVLLCYAHETKGQHSADTILSPQCRERRLCYYTLDTMATSDWYRYSSLLSAQTGVQLCYIPHDAVATFDSTTGTEVCLQCWERRSDFIIHITHWQHSTNYLFFSLAEGVTRVLPCILHYGNFRLIQTLISRVSEGKLTPVLSFNITHWQHSTNTGTDFLR